MQLRDHAFTFAITAVLLGQPAMAADDRREYGPFVVDRAVLAGLAGKLDVRLADGDAARLSVSGPAEAVAALVVDAAQGRLSVTAPARGHSVTVVDRVTVVTGPGARSDVVIGGSSIASASSRNGGGAALDIVLHLPAGAALALAGFTGDATIGDLLAPVDIQAIGGAVRTGAVLDAALAAIGDGSIEAASVTGDLDASVTGAGRIVVQGGELGAVEVEITGAGVIEVAAPALSAVVNMVGDGTVWLAEVAGEPVVNRVGSGRFDTGPR